VEQPRDRRPPREHRRRVARPVDEQHREEEVEHVREDEERDRRLRRAQRALDARELKQEEHRERAAGVDAQVARPERGHGALRADHAREDRPREGEREDAEDERQGRDGEDRLPHQRAHPRAIAAPVRLGDHRRRGRGQAVAHDRADRRELIADAERAERGPRDLGLEARDHVRVDEVERRLEAHPERDREAEAEHLRRDGLAQDPRLRLHGGAHRGARFDATLGDEALGAAAPRRSKQVSGMSRLPRSKRVPSMKFVVTGS
jgi:hypothetical protein